MRGIAWRLYLGTGALATGAYYLLPEAGGAVLNVVVGASAVAAIAAGIRWHRPARRLAWWLIALDGELETVVYRVTQEALLNVASHAEAGRLWLELDGAADRVDLEIRDDGVGFEPQATSALVHDGHFGLMAMQERVEMAGGRFQLDTHPGAGVVLRAMFRTVPAA